MTVKRRIITLSQKLGQDTSAHFGSVNSALTQIVDDINSQMTTLTDTQTLTNKTLTAPTLATPSITGNLSSTGIAQFNSGTSVAAGGATSDGIKVSSVTNFGIFWGSGAPTLSVAQGSLYIRTDGSTNNNRFYVATTATGGWTAVTTGS